MRVLFLGALAAASSFTSVTYVYYDDAACAKPVSTIVRPIGACIKEMREGHYRKLSCSAEGLVADTEYSDPDCQTPVLAGLHKTNVCHEGAGHSLLMKCGDSTQFTVFAAQWTPPTLAKKFLMNVNMTSLGSSLGSTGSCPGVCQPTSTSCASGYRSGLCPGASNIECCPMPTSSCNGQCQQNSLPCGGSYVSGQCPGGNDIQCCTSSTGCVARDTVIQRLVDKANGQYCECVCPHLSPWRCDCSGIASYAWELAAPGQVTQTLPRYSTRLAAWADMKPGDIILKPDQHVEVFRNWETGTSVFGYCGCHNTADGCSCRTGSTASYWQGAGYYPAKGNNVC